jgi:hypothetical protein
MVGAHAADVHTNARVTARNYSHTFEAKRNIVGAVLYPDIAIDLLHRRTVLVRQACHCFNALVVYWLVY